MPPESHDPSDDPLRTRDLPAGDPLPLEAKERIDRVCMAFEDAWKAGQRPPIEESLKDTAGPERSALLWELLRVELDYRRGAAEEPTPDEYHARFPHDAEILDKFFQQPPAYAAEQPPGTKVRYFGDYELLASIAHGGMGVVYKARQISLDRLVALKMIRESQLASPEAVERFHREAEAAAALQHPNIVAIHEIGQHQGQHYFSMDYVDGQSLRELAGGTPLPAKRAAAYVKTIAEAVHYAHQQGTLHRDLKPANILIDRDGRPRITDFGVAKRVKTDPGLTLAGEVLGTPSYMPPEQAQGRWSEVGPASDVYSLGAILYELVTGRPPFKCETVTDTLLQVLDSEPIAPRLLNPKVPRDLETIALKCLEKEATKRYSTAEGLADELGRFLRGEPIRARPVTRVQRLWRWCRREPAIAALTAATVLLLAAVAAIATVGYFQSEASRRTAEANLYLSQIALADREWRANRVAHAEQILDACPEELRQWEWYYLKRLCHADRLTIAVKPHPRTVFLPRLVYSPDGTRIAYGGANEATTIWDARTGQLILTLEGSRGWPAFSPDGRRIVAGRALPPPDSPGVERVTVWDASTGKAVITLPKMIENAALYSPDGKWIASVNKYTVTGNVVTLWDAASGREEFTLTPNAFIRSIAWSPDGKRIAVATERRTLGELNVPNEVRVYDVATRRESILLSEGACITGLAFSPDGKWLATGAVTEGIEGGSVKIWDASTGRVIYTLRADDGVHYAVRQWPDRVWDAPVPSGPYYGVNHVAFSGDGRHIACASWDGTTKIWEAETGRELATLRGQAGVAGSVAFSPDGTRIATSNSEGTVKIWDVGNPEARSIPGFGYVGGVALGADRNGLRVAAGTAISALKDAESESDRIVRVFDTSTGRVSLRPDPASPSGALAISPDGNWVALLRGGPRRRKPTLTVQNTSTGQDAWDLDAGLLIDLPLRNVVFSHDSRRIAVATGDGMVYVREVTGGRELLSFRAVETRSVTCVAFSPDDKRIASGSRDGTVRIWDAEAGHLLCTFKGHADEVGCVTFSPDGTRLVSVAPVYCQKGGAMVWDAATGEELLTLGASSDPIAWAAWSPDGKRMITTDLAALRVWDAATGHEILAIPVAGVSAAFAPDGRQIVVDRPVYVGLGLISSPRLLDARVASPQQRAAELLVDGLLDEYVSARDVIERIRTYPRCSEAVRQAAMEIARSRPENPDLRSWEAWQAVRVSGRHPDFYRAYLRRMDNLCRLCPDRGDYLVTLGAAQYRLADYGSALGTLTAAEKALSKSPGGVSAACLAYLAMSQQQLGRIEEARANLDRLRGKWTPRDESEELLHAAEAAVPDESKQELTLKGFSGHLRFHPDDSLLVGMEDGTILRYDAELKNVTAKYPSALGGVENLAVSPDGTRLAVARQEGGMELLEVPSGKSLAVIAVAGFRVAGAAVSPDGQRLAVVVSSKRLDKKRRNDFPQDVDLRIHSATDGKLLSSEKIPTVVAKRQCVDWKGSLIAIQGAVEGGKPGVLLWDVERRAKLHHLSAGANTLSVAIAPDGKRVAAGLSGSGQVLIWSTESGKLLGELEGRTNGTYCLAFSPNGRRLASESDSSHVRVWDSQTKEPVYLLPLSRSLRSVSFDSTGQRLACGMSGGRIEIWRLRR